MASLDYTSGDGKQSLRHHPVGNVGNVALSGEPVESPRVNKGDSFFLLRRNHCHFGKHI
jgi:hypothetical protein